MKSKKHDKECQETLEKLIGKEVKEAWFKTDDDCWTLHIRTDQGKMVMTFCDGWNCPELEHRKISEKAEKE